MTAAASWRLVHRGTVSADGRRREARFSQGNGYVGFRGVTEESYPGEDRFCTIAGLFDRGAGDLEVPEAPNVADPLHLEWFIGGEPVRLGDAEAETVLDLSTGVLTRTVEGQTVSGETVRCVFERAASLADPHLVALRSSLTVKAPTRVELRSGLDGEVTNDGVQHLTERYRRVEGLECLLQDRTIESGVDVDMRAVHRVRVDGLEVALESRGHIGRRSVEVRAAVEVPAGATVTVEKVVSVATSRDPLGRQAVVAAADLPSYGDVLARHLAAWAAFWERHDVVLHGADPEDQLALRFSLYHLRSMTSFDDDRVGISAKGFTGTGYKGHSFWDTEVYILPVWSLFDPDVASALLRYRIGLLPSARVLAEERGYAGAMFPWESAWPTDGEVTPTRGNWDLATGERDHIWTGGFQHHISAVVAHALWTHARRSGDDDLLTGGGDELLFDVARFWESRIRWDGKVGHIDQVIGPDEYKEFVDDNAFTNHLAAWSLRTAHDRFAEVGRTDPTRLASIVDALGVRADEPDAWLRAATGLHLPDAGPDGVVPQDATYLALPPLPGIDRYRKLPPFAVLKDYPMSDLSGFQVSKQADLAVLFHLLPDVYNETTQRRNLEFYEARTLHDSSLSASLYALTAARLGMPELAWSMWERARAVDLGDQAACAGGIHAASMGGLVQAAATGFAGLGRVGPASFVVRPALPQGWRAVEVPAAVGTAVVRFVVFPDRVEVTADQATRLEVNGRSIHTGEAAVSVTVVDR